MNYLKILLILCAVIIVVVAIITVLAYAFYSTTSITTVTSSELNSTGNCTIVNTQSKPENTILCNNGESFDGFKLLKVNAFSVQLLVYNDCPPCMHDSTNSNSFVKIINVGVSQNFGGGCGGIYYPSVLMATSVKNETATFKSNMSGTTICV